MFFVCEEQFTSTLLSYSPTEENKSIKNNQGVFPSTK